MSFLSNYSARASYISYSFPRLSIVLTSVNFWIASYLVFFVAISIFSTGLFLGTEREGTVQYWGWILLALVFGLLFGIVAGFTDIAVEKSKLREYPLYMEFVLRSVFYLVGFSITFWVAVQFAQWFIMPRVNPDDRFEFMPSRLRYIFFALLIFTAAMSVVINFIREANRTFGPGVLIPLLLGHYRQPVPEERLFVFMDLKGSTALAEQLGEERYSRFIRKALNEINAVVPRYYGQIYQYVGDEVVLTWPCRGGKELQRSILFFLACQTKFNDLREYFMAEFEFVPVFKAGIHRGSVMAVEVGDIKREIAYHGDTINAASRIQALCNEMHTDLIISDDIMKEVTGELCGKFVNCGEIMLRGKERPLALWKMVGG